MKRTLQSTFYIFHFALNLLVGFHHIRFDDSCDVAAADLHSDLVGDFNRDDIVPMTGDPAVDPSARQHLIAHL